MRYVRYAVLAVLVIVLVSIAMANRDLVTIEFLPRVLSDLVGFHWSLTLPLFLVVLGGVLVGLLIGFVWEWIREHKHRREAAARAREARRLEREVTRLKGQRHEGKDDVLALLDETA
jgi:uncharacterized integral membrane protein